MNPMTRALEARLIRLERQRHQPRSVRAMTDAQLLRGTLAGHSGAKNGSYPQHTTKQRSV